VDVVLALSRYDRPTIQYEYIAGSTSRLLGLRTLPLTDMDTHGTLLNVRRQTIPTRDVLFGRNILLYTICQYRW